MSRQRLAAESFERSHDLIAAINVIAIHTRLSLAGRDDEARQPQVEDARARLAQFLEQLAPLASDIEHDGEAPVVGTDPRLTALAHQFVTARQGSNSPALRRMEPEHALRLLKQARMDAVPQAERVQVVEFLRALRSLLESSSHADVSGLLGVL